MHRKSIVAVLSLLEMLQTEKSEKGGLLMQEDYRAFARWACRDLYTIQRYFGASVEEISRLSKCDRADLFSLIEKEGGND